ncbi:MAG: hypothetical protein ACLU18_17105 [Bacteroides thetaiotaomicron]
MDGTDQATASLDLTSLFTITKNSKFQAVDLSIGRKSKK